MPYRWDREPDLQRLTLWPHRSMTAGGFVLFIGVTAAMSALPMLVHLGHPTLWVLLPFVLGALALTWTLLRRNGRDRAALGEVLTLSADRAHQVRTDPGGRPRDWRAHPNRVRVVLHQTGGPVENYLTLTGGDREVEIGAFLSPDERVLLKPELERALRTA
jgi:uncharacterized membrane protein